MSKSSEEVLLIVKNVKNKKTDGTLYMMGERMAWMLESKNVFNISYLYADIKSQKISPDSKDKVQLQVILNDGSANTFLFNTSRGRQTQQSDREGVKEILQNMLPQFKRKISAELEEKNKLLQEDPESFQLYKDLVVSGVVTPDEFWASRQHMLTKSHQSSSSQKHGQNAGVSPAFLADIKPVTDGANGLKYNLTQDIIESIFKTYPMVKKKHAEAVPHTVTESDFWSRFFQSHYFHRDRCALPPKDIFTECARSDEKVMNMEMSKNCDDPLLDLTQIKDSCLEDDYRGIVDDTRASNNTANQAMIRRFNQHSTLVLRAGTNASLEEPPPGDDGEGSKKSKKSKSVNDYSNILNGGVAALPPPTQNGAAIKPVDRPYEPHKKKRKIRDKILYEDLSNKNDTEGVSLQLTHMDRYLRGPTPSTSTHSSNNPNHHSNHVLTEDAISAVAREVDGWSGTRRLVMEGSEALSVLGELSPGGALMSGTTLQQLHQQVSPTTRDEIRQNYSAMCELLRHFWSCFPVASKATEEKVQRMRMTLERFEMSKLVPLKEKMTQYHYTMNLTGHLEEMLRSAYLKFDTWQAKRNALARRP